MKKSINDLMKLHTEAGGHFFDKDTMGFWQSKVHDTVISPKEDCLYFITSEANFDDTKRLYTIRKMVINNPVYIETIGEFQQYKTLIRAKTALNKFIK